MSALGFSRLLMQSRKFWTCGVMLPEDRALTVGEVSRRAGLPLATASRMVADLVEHGLLSRYADRRVRVGTRLWALASRASPTLSLRELAMPVLEELLRVVGHHAQLGVLDGPLPRFTPATITDPGELRRRLADVRRQGFVLCPGHLHPDATGIAVPVRDETGAVAAAVSVIVPNDEHARGHVSTLTAAARRIEERLRSH